jgi:uncharacterized protein (TIGR04222 family)
LHGFQFLLLYAELGVIAVAASFLIPPFLRPEGNFGRPADEDELALLAGGRTRFAEAVAVRLLASGAATVEGTAGLRIRDPRGGRTLAEQRVIAMPSPMTWNDVTAALAVLAQSGEQRLEDKGLRMTAAIALQLRLIQAAPLALLFGFGTIKWIVGAMRERPVGVLTVFLVITLIAALARYSALDRRTRAGKQAVAQACRDAARLRRAAPKDEAPRAVALFGTAVLAGSYLSDFHRMRSAGGGDGSSSSGCSSGGGCGGGGGGCGGCGS